MAKKKRGEVGGDLVKAILSGKAVMPDGYKPKPHGDHKRSFTSVRKVVYRDKTINVRTTYRIEIDGEPLVVHTTVQNDGGVRCHSLPNYVFPSAIDMAKALVDATALLGEVKDEIGGAGKKPAKGGRHGGSH
jgi:hypothetical protein